MRAMDRNTIVDALKRIHGEMGTLMDLVYHLSAAGRFSDEEEDASVRLDECLVELEGVLKVFEQ